MPYIKPESTYGTAVSLMAYHMAEKEPLSVETLVVEMLTHSDCYYASNPKDIAAYLRANYDAIKQEAIEENE